MSLLRFSSAREVLEAFPSARADIGVDLVDETPVACVQRLVDGTKLDAAMSFCAYVLPRREAVWWGCRAFRLLFDQSAGGASKRAMPPALEAAEAWVRRPDDALRRAALGMGLSSDNTAPATWLALGAGWAGGSMSPSEHPVPAPPHLTAKAVRAALLLALGADPLGRARDIKAIVALGLRVAQGDETL